MRDKLGIASGERTELCRASHAEMNAICFAARNGVSLKGAEIYSSWQPCSLCSKLIINSGIHVVHFRREVPDKLGLELLAESGVKVVRHCIKLKDDKDEELKNKI
jgi:dCMP deaminase